MLTPDEVRFFRDNGYLIMRGIIPPRDVDELRRAAEALQEDAVSKLAHPDYLAGAKRLNADWIEHDEDHYVYREKQDGAFVFHRIERLYGRDPVFARIAMSNALLNNVWQILGRPFWPRAGNMVLKLPHEGAPVRWHQDIPYLYWSAGGHPGRGRPSTHPIPNFTTDIYLDSSSETNGCLYAVPGSHRGGTVDVDRLVAEHGWRLPGSVPLELEPGDVMFHHVAVVHGSAENRSPALRRTFYIHYLADETVADAYGDWPDLLTPEQNVEMWSGALADRRRAAGTEDDEPLRFEVTPDGLTPVTGR